MTSAKFWDKAAEKYARDKISDMPAYEHTLDRMTSILQPHHRVLELGCGTGSTALDLAGGVDRYIGTDISTEMVRIAQSKLDSHDLPQLGFQVQDAATFASGNHDVILALNLLHLLPDLEEIVAKIFSALPSGGVFISKTGLLKAGPWYIRAMIPVMQMVGKAPFVRNLSEAELIAMLQAEGFEIRETLVQDGLAPRVFVVATKP